MRFTFLSTTSKHNKEFIKLPDKKVFNDLRPNFLVTDLDYLKQLVVDYNQNDMYFLLDTEKKQNISLYDEINIENKIDYKPNDLTMEAADLSILNYFNRRLSNKSIAIYGTGNIAFKLALRLSERNAQIYMYGRDDKKVNICINALKQITFDRDLINYGDNKAPVDCLVSFVSSEEIIDETFLRILNGRSLCLDGGIGNFSKEFIKNAIVVGHEVRRLDVRQSQEIMDGYIYSRLNSEFDNIIGSSTINGHSVVAGGIMGEEGQAIIDRIYNPSKVIGIANGIGGVKDESELNSEEQSKIKEVQAFIE
ncbi:hypothetical protein [Salinicoccus albus]|uniref:hypothetical protein n=1 Tax=Salinicoccus albus TaxID=418756 RepID=UPI000364B4F2|nr:hypothetical protein [Salinicoccus albus]